jgi:S-phase kinase-associated protein 1
MTDEDDELITLVSKESEEISVHAEAAKLSDLVATTLEEGDDTVHVPRVSSTCLRKVVQFLEHYRFDAMKEIPTPLGGTSLKEIVDQVWYQEYVENEDCEMLFDLVTAANYMGIKPLLDLTCLKVTFELTGKNAEEIRVILDLPMLTAEEEEKARQEHKWVFEDA